MDDLIKTLCRCKIAVQFIKETVLYCRYQSYAVILNCKKPRSLHLSFIVFAVVEKIVKYLIDKAKLNIVYIPVLLTVTEYIL